MDYPFETLNPETFQGFCQALLAREYRDLQSFPVAQPDGGRDAIAYFPHQPSRDFIVFQVKYVRNPWAIADPHKWLIDIVREELPKINKLIPRGARHYILMTNVPGTAHLSSGSIDRVQDILQSSISIPAQCWWRDDISRKLDNAWDLKWLYPTLMTGPDLLRAILESGLTEQVERRSAAIRSFVRDQYRTDREVKFKQVELQNRLLELFIDIPVGARSFQDTRSHRVQLWALHTVAWQYRQASGMGEDETTTDSEGAVRARPRVGAATFFLSQLLQQNTPRVVLEGAPGQGKSTITQYICQVHRMRILNERADFSRVPNHHHESPIRLPFKVDLRDLASWLVKRNPFTAEREEVPAELWNKSLESFLAAQVRHHSGGTEFTVADLHAVVKLSSVLLVFDGLDEVADISRRQDVVDEIARGVDRLEGSAASLQVIVTSRPAAFANSPGLPPEDFPHFFLESLPRSLIEVYASKWLQARRIGARESADFNRILKEKLDQPHLRDLARNPMQLAILLSLILTRGASLPDKRTALYDNYIELFFSRESEKSSIVRTYRDLLIDIHRFLAWTLHSEAEQGEESGSISTQRLHELLASYLQEQEYDPRLASTLFTGMVERVVALVSRVEGTFEFEVQPLREYFAARYLYETAPYSPTGAERRGTKPDRFDALAKNFYWLNVARFYAGCYSKGELASLIDRLQDLIHAEGFNRTNHPRLLSAMLLSDWVFSQHPKSVREVIKLMLDGMGLRFVLPSQSRRSAGGASLMLPTGCGRAELVDHCLHELGSMPPKDYALDIVDLLNANSTADELAPVFVNELTFNVGDNRTKWFEYALRVGILSPPYIPLPRLLELMEDSPYDTKRLELLIRARRSDYIASSSNVYQAAVGAVFNRDIVLRRARSWGAIEMLGHVLDPLRYSAAFSSPHPIPLGQVWDGEHKLVLAESSIPNEEVRTHVNRINAVISTALLEATRPAAEWATSLTPWENFIEATRSAVGNNWAISVLSNVASGIKSSTETCTAYPDLLNDADPLCRRARYARLRAGSPGWWTKQLNHIRDEDDGAFASLVSLTWASEGTLSALSGQLDLVIGRLSTVNWQRLADGLTTSLHAINRLTRRPFLLDVDKLPLRLSERTVTLLGLRARRSAQGRLFMRYLTEYTGNDQVVLDFCQRAALSADGPLLQTWENALAFIKRAYLQDAISEPFASHTFLRRLRGRPMPPELAHKVAENPSDYPGYVLAVAESVCRNELASSIVPVGIVAEDDGWFT